MLHVPPSVARRRRAEPSFLPSPPSVHNSNLAMPKLERSDFNEVDTSSNLARKISKLSYRRRFQLPQMRQSPRTPESGIGMYIKANNSKYGSDDDDLSSIGSPVSKAQLELRIMSPRLDHSSDDLSCKQCGGSSSEVSDYDSLFLKNVEESQSSNMAPEKPASAEAGNIEFQRMPPLLEFSNTFSLPLLYLGPIALARPERYASLGHCVKEALQEYSQRASPLISSPEGTMIALSGPAPTYNICNRDQWVINIATFCDSALPGNGTCESSEFTSFEVDDKAKEISNIDSVRKIHGCVTRLIEDMRFQDSLILLFGLLTSLELSLQKFGNTNEINYDCLIQDTKRNMATIQLSLGRFRHARNILCCADNTKMIDILSNSLLGLALCGNKELDKACKVFSEVASNIGDIPSGEPSSQKLDPDDAKGITLNNLGCCLLKLKQYKRANNNFQTAVQALGGTRRRSLIAFCFCNMAKNFVQMKDYDAAINALQEAVVIFRKETLLDDCHLASTLKAMSYVSVSVKGK